jgi:hypothetical protein
MLLHVTCYNGHGCHCAFLLPWPEAHVQQCAEDAGGEQI